MLTACGCGVCQWQVGSRLDVSTEALAHDMLRGMGGAAATTPGLVGNGVAAVRGRRLDAVRPRRRRCGAPCRSTRAGKGAAAVEGRSLSLEGAKAAVAHGAKMQARRGEGRGCDGATGRRCRTKSVKRQSDGSVRCDATCRADARCYAARYPDVGSLLCADGSPCLFVKLLNHYHARGRKKGRAFHCPATLFKRCKRLSSWAGTEERSALTEALSCHINASGVPHDVELRDAFCTSSYKKQLSTPPWPAFASGLEMHVHDSAGCDLHALGAHLEAQGQLQETCSDPPAAAASFSSDAKRRVTSSPSLGIAESGLPRRPVLSVVVLIFRNTIKPWLMLESFARQQTSFPYEVVIADKERGPLDAPAQPGGSYRSCTVRCIIRKGQ